MRVSGLITAAMAASALLAQPAGAAQDIPVNNGGFEEGVGVADGAYLLSAYYGTTGWGWSSGSGTGRWNPTNHHFLDEASHGVVGYANGPVDTIPHVGVLGQVVSGVVIEANTLYTLTLDVGQALNETDWGYNFGLLALPSDPGADAFILASLSGMIDPATGLPLAVGHFTTLSLSFQTGDTGAEIGQSLIIALGGLGRGAAYDNLKLESSSLVASAVPEPSTWAMMLFGFGAAGTALRRSRKRSAQTA